MVAKSAALPAFKHSEAEHWRSMGLLMAQEYLQSVAFNKTWNYSAMQIIRSTIRVCIQYSERGQQADIEELLDCSPANVQRTTSQS
jgi:hypothetical protein